MTNDKPTKRGRPDRRDARFDIEPGLCIREGAVIGGAYRAEPAGLMVRPDGARLVPTLAALELRDPDGLTTFGVVTLILSPLADQ